MASKPSRASELFRISEPCLPLYGWPPDDGRDRLEVIEEDLRGLIRQLAEAQFALREGERAHLDETRRVLLGLLEVADAFGRVFRNIQAKEEEISPQMKIWLGNFRTVRRLLERVLAERGVVRIENLDRGFDPHWHKVTDVVVDGSLPDGTIVEETTAGYLWRGEILRKAEVVVASERPERTG